MLLSMQIRQLSRSTMQPLQSCQHTSLPWRGGNRKSRHDSQLPLGHYRGSCSSKTIAHLLRKDCDVSQRKGPEVSTAWSADGDAAEVSLLARILLGTTAALQEMLSIRVYFCECHLLEEASVPQTSGPAWQCPLCSLPRCPPMDRHAKTFDVTAAGWLSSSEPRRHPLCCRPRVQRQHNAEQRARETAPCP